MKMILLLLSWSNLVNKRHDAKVVIWTSFHAIQECKERLYIHKVCSDIFKTWSSSFFNNFNPGMAWCRMHSNIGFAVLKALLDYYKSWCGSRTFFVSSFVSVLSPTFQLSSVVNALFSLILKEEINIAIGNNGSQLIGSDWARANNYISLSNSVSSLGSQLKCINKISKRILPVQLLQTHSAQYC